MRLLDHGSIELLDCMGNDLAVVNAARVSYAKESKKFCESDVKLLKYLWKNGHTTPFEQAVLKFRVKAPIFVFRQWHRHRTQSYNEVSARYSMLPEDFYVPEPSQILTQSQDNKQGRSVIGLPNAENVASIIRRACLESFVVYDHLLELGLARELARCVLPVNTYSEMIVTANLLNWLRFVKLRSDSHAQYEIRVYSNAVFETIREKFPVTADAFKEGK